MGAVLCTDEVSKGFGPGSHATTFGGGAVLSAVASKVMDIMVDEDMAGRALELGAFAREEAEKLMAKHPGKIAGTRGLGLLFGIELTFDGKEVWKGLMDNRVVCNLTQGKILRLVPPLTIEKQDILEFMGVLDSVLAGVDGPSA